jgi:hypothetical protein
MPRFLDNKVRKNRPLESEIPSSDPDPDPGLIGVKSRLFPRSRPNRDSRFPEIPAESGSGAKSRIFPDPGPIGIGKIPAIFPAKSGRGGAGIRGFRGLPANGTPMRGGEWHRAGRVSTSGRLWRHCGTAVDQMDSGDGRRRRRGKAR